MLLTNEQAAFVLEEAFPDHPEYRLGEFIDHGSFGGVWKVEGTPQLAVIKMVPVGPPEDLTMTEAQRQRMIDINIRCAEREMKLLKKFSSDKAFPTLFDGRVYVPACGGGRVYRYLEERLYPLSEWKISPYELALRVGAAGCAAVQKMQKVHWIYRDFKPANVLVRKTNSGKCEAVLADFGASKEKVGNGVDTVIIGAYGFAAPEVLCQNRFVPGKSDVYSIAISILDLIGGEPLLYDEDPAVWQKKLQQRLEYVEAQSPVLEKLLRKMLRTNPMFRPSLSSCAAQLEALLPPDPDRDSELVRSKARQALAAYQRGALEEARRVTAELPEAAAQKHLLGGLLADSSAERVANLRIAARLGSRTATYYVGVSLLCGEGVRQDKALGLQYLELADAARFQPAHQLLTALQRGEKPAPQSARESLFREIAK